MCSQSKNENEFSMINDLGGSVTFINKGKSYILSVLSNLDIGLDDENKKAFFTGKSQSIRLTKSIEWIKKYADNDFVLIYKLTLF